MTTKAPPIPPDQLPEHARGQPQGGDIAGQRGGAGQAGNADVNLDQQGRTANLRQNVNDVQHKVQDR